MEREEYKIIILGAIILISAIIGVIFAGLTTMLLIKLLMVL